MNEQPEKRGVRTGHMGNKLTGDIGNSIGCENALE